METKNIITDKLSTFVFLLSILFFTVGLNLQDNPPGGWYQQFLPDLNNMPISDIEFLDSLVGFAVTNNNTGQDTGYILKTTNGGDNWSIIFKDRRDFSRIIFINDNTGFTCGGTGSGTPYLYKTTDTGNNWFIVNSPDKTFWDDMSVLNEDTIWLADGDSFNGGLIRTTNGGQSWTQQYFSSSFNPNKIYMFNKNIGFFGEGFRLYRTTNSGLNWNQIISEAGFSDMYFIDSLTGWKAAGDIKKTTNGGLNWNTQAIPSGGMLYWSTLSEFSNVNNDTMWGVGGLIKYGSYNERGIIWKTTNGGKNWGYQVPDTSIHLWRYYHIDFTNKLNGWSFVPNSDVHTITGGNDTTYYTGLKLVGNQVPKELELYQNYPNPFNPLTNISFEISKSMDVKLIVYNIIGKEVSVLVNKKLNTGSYEVEWDGSNYPSGVYFYKLITKDYSETKKMLLVK